MCLNPRIFSNYVNRYLDFICILIVAWHKTSRDIESDLSVIKIPWTGEPVPDHTTLTRRLQTIPQEWLDTILAKTATLCVAEAGSATGPLGADSSSVETTRYETVTRPLKSEKGFVEMGLVTYWGIILHGKRRGTPWFCAIFETQKLPCNDDQAVNDPRTCLLTLILDLPTFSNTM